MRRQIILEIEEEGTENIVADIIGMMRDKVDMNCEFKISQKILPEKISEEKEIKIPVFFQNSCMRQQGKEMGKAICIQGEACDNEARYAFRDEVNIC